MIYAPYAKLQCAVFAALSLSACAAAPKAVAGADFENPKYTVGEAYGATNQRLDWTLTSGPSRMNTDTAVITDAHAYDGTRSLCINYAAKEQAVKQAAWGLAPARSYTLSYAVRFDHGFAFNGSSSAQSGKNGGKLPGLAGRGIDGSLCAGGMDCADGGGFTARLMWRTDGQAVLYLYDHTKSVNGRQYGENFAFETLTHFIPGQWHHITETVTLNTDGKADGRIDIWMDGTQVVSVSEREIVTRGEQVDTVLFSTFFGGNSPEWFPATPQTAYFDSFKVTR